MTSPNIRLLNTSVAGYKEDESKGPMLRFEDSLPRLPVPTLEETAQKYLKSVHPLLSPTEFERTTKLVTDFIKPGGVGEKLQRKLIAKREDSRCRNWMIEWWNEAAYLGYRDPVVPYVSYFYSHKDDVRRKDPATRAAAITTAVLEFKKHVDNKTLEPEFMKNLPMSMSSYEWMFNACRIPAKPSDRPVKYSPDEHKYFVVAHKNLFWRVMHEENGRQLTALELEQQFKRIYKVVDSGPAIGMLTTEDRDVWTKARQRLIAAHPANLEALQTIEASSFLICLDDASPVTLEERAHQYWHGNGANRWFDKPCQFIINENGTSGFMGEHSMMDGTPTHRLNDTINALIFSKKLDLSNRHVREDLSKPQLLHIHTNQKVIEDIESASVRFKQRIAQHELAVQAYQAYGKRLIKQFNCSPDAYVQMIIQLAYHKMYGKNRPTYESAATRKFQMGRTETCRSVSDESVAFCNAMADTSTSSQVREELFRKAIAAHVKYISEACDGRGVDRHLFGLKKLLEPGESLPELFTDAAYGYSSTWYISTSQLSSEYFNGYGWSQVVDGGWGIAYMINENSIQFNIVSKRLGSDRMSYYLNEAAGDIRDLLLPSVLPKARL